MAPRSLKVKVQPATPRQSSSRDQAFVIDRGFGAGDRRRVGIEALLGFDVALIFFGIHVALLGYLVFRSTYLPRIIGLLLMLGGVGCLANSVISLLALGAMSGRVLVLLAPVGLSEFAIAVWLLVAGANAQKWEQLVQPPLP